MNGRAEHRENPVRRDRRPPHPAARLRPAAARVDRGVAGFAQPAERLGHTWAVSATVDPVELATAPVGRRERKKEATRERLRRAGMQLFAIEGFDRTTVRDIAEAADVAERTFYRHFESKEALLLDDLRRYLAAAEAVVAERPVEEPPMACLLAVTEHLRPEWEVPGDQLLFLAELITNHDATRGHLHRLLDEHQERLSVLFAERRGLPAPDYRCHLEAAVAGMAFTQSVGRFMTDRSVSNWDLGIEAIRFYAAGCDPSVVEGMEPLIEPSA